MSVYFSLSVILVFVSVFGGSTASWNCTLNVTRRGVGEVEDLHCLEYHLTSSVCSALNQDLPIPDSDLSVDPPINMEMTTSRVAVNESSKIVYGTQIELSWGPPQSGIALKYLKGFMVNCVSITGPDCGSCVMFDLQGSNLDKDMVFNWKQEPLLPERAMSIQMELSALPRAEVNRQALARATAVPQKGTTEVIYPSYWRAPMVVKVKEGNVSLSFDYPTQDFVFNHFDVRLIQGREIVQQERLAMYKHQTKGTHVFPFVPAGNFTVQVEPVDDHQNDEENCHCYRGIYEDFDGIRECWTCIISQVHITVIGVAPPTTTKSTPTQTSSSSPSPHTSPSPQASSSPSSTSRITTEEGEGGAVGTPPVPQEVRQPTGATDTEIALAIVGTLLFVVVILAFVLVMKNKKKKKKCFSYDSKGPTNFPGNTEKPAGIYTVISESPPATKKTVLVLSADDHIHHLTAVKTFVSYLQEVAQCRVIFPPYCLTELSKNWKDWMFKSLDTADYVILVNSQALCYMMAADKRNEAYKYKPLTDTGHMIVGFVQEVDKDARQVDSSNKYIHVMFDHTPNEFLLEQPATNNTFRIVDSIDQLVQHIQAPCDGQKPHPYFSEVLAQKIVDTPSGKDLKEAVCKSARFEKSDVLWFSDRFGHAYGRDCVRSDSGYDSLPVETDSDAILDRMEKINQMSDDDRLYPPTSPDGEILATGFHGDQFLDFLPPDVVSTSTNQPSIFIPPQTLSELECQSLSPSALIRNINQQSVVREEEEEEEEFLPHFSRC